MKLNHRESKVMNSGSKKKVTTVLQRAINKGHFATVSCRGYKAFENNLRKNGTQTWHH